MIDERESRLGNIIRIAVNAALDDGLSGRDIIRRLESETTKLKESLPPEGARHWKE